MPGAAAACCGNVEAMARMPDERQARHAAGMTVRRRMAQDAWVDVDIGIFFPWDLDQGVFLVAPAGRRTAANPPAGAISIFTVSFAFTVRRLSARAVGRVVDSAVSE